VLITNAAVYMVRVTSASRFALLDDGKQELVVKNGYNLDRTGSGMKEQADKLIPLVAME
jgi:hypothetical protein